MGDYLKHALESIHMKSHCLAFLSSSKSPRITLLTNLDRAQNYEITDSLWGLYWTRNELKKLSIMIMVQLKLAAIPLKFIVFRRKNMEKRRMKNNI